MKKAKKAEVAKDLRDALAKLGDHYGTLATDDRKLYMLCTPGVSLGDKQVWLSVCLEDIWDAQDHNRKTIPYSRIEVSKERQIKITDIIKMAEGIKDDLF